LVAAAAVDYIVDRIVVAVHTVAAAVVFDVS
jgi:hypothetical protein